MWSTHLSSQFNPLPCGFLLGVVNAISAEQVLCSQPFSHLGVVKNQQKSVLRVWRPNVKEITIKWENAALANVTVTSQNGLFETPLPKEHQGALSPKA